jgi:PKD repeat protein
MKNLTKLTWITLMMFSFVFISACSSDDDDDDVQKPVATFQFEVSTENSLEVSFTNYSQNATSYAWDFGDNAGTSTEKNPTYTYANGGTYTVTLTATNSAGSAEHSKEVTVINPSADNHIQNGTFDDESVWEVLQHNPNNTGTLTIADGVAVFNAGVQGEWGSEPHIGINQAVTVAAGQYQLNLDITTNGIDEVWFEVWVGTGEPVSEEDYTEDNGATKVLSFNSWECGGTNNVYSGPMAAVSCQDTDGSITLDAGTYYVVIRSGGITFGDDGVVIDNVTMVKVD